MPPEPTLAPGVDVEPKLSPEFEIEVVPDGSNANGELVSAVNCCMTFPLGSPGVAYGSAALGGGTDSFMPAFTESECCPWLPFKLLASTCPGDWLAILETIPADALVKFDTAAWEDTSAGAFVKLVGGALAFGNPFSPYVRLLTPEVGLVIAPSKLIDGGSSKGVNTGGEELPLPNPNSLAIPDANGKKFISPPRNPELPDELPDPDEPVGLDATKSAFVIFSDD
jgi:hypothetical protein